jgi:hypothetical protein
MIGILLAAAILALPTGCVGIPGTETVRCPTGASSLTSEYADVPRGVLTPDPSRPPLTVWVMMMVYKAVAPLGIPDEVFHTEKACDVERDQVNSIVAKGVTTECDEVASPDNGGKP